MRKVREQVCQRALTQKQKLYGAQQLGDLRLVEAFTQLGDTLGGVGAFTFPIEAAELVVGQAATGRRSVNGR